MFEFVTCWIYSACPKTPGVFLWSVTAHQHVHVQNPAVLSGADTQAAQVQTVPVIKDFIQIVTQLYSELLAATTFKLRCGVCRAETEGKQRTLWWLAHMAPISPTENTCRLVRFVARSTNNRSVTNTHLVTPLFSEHLMKVSTSAASEQPKVIKFILWSKYLLTSRQRTPDNPHLAPWASASRSQLLFPQECPSVPGTTDKSLGHFIKV